MLMAARSFSSNAPCSSAICRRNTVGGVMSSSVAARQRRVQGGRAVWHRSAVCPPLWQGPDIHDRLLGIDRLGYMLYRDSMAAHALDRVQHYETCPIGEESGRPLAIAAFHRGRRLLAPVGGMYAAASRVGIVPEGTNPARGGRRMINPMSAFLSLEGLNE
jgi:hypothetical protein